jgi:hypothetical protein
LSKFDKCFLQENKKYLFFLRIGGMTATSLAVEEGMKMLNATDSENKILVLVTDGSPTSTYEPCQYATDLKDAGIETIVIGVGEWDQSQVACIAYNPNDDPDNPYIINIVNFETFSNILADFNSIVCPGAVGSPFDDTYLQTDIRWNDRFVYRSGSFDMIYNGVEWSINDPNLGSFISVDGGSNQVVDSIKTWNHFNTDGSFNSSWTSMMTSCDGNSFLIFPLCSGI